MDIEHLTHLRDLILDPNVSRVARLSHQTQSNLSKRIKQFESEFGIQLFHRRGFKGLEPTQDALALLPRIDAFIKGWSESIAAFRHKPKDAQLVKVIGPSLFMRYVFIPKWFELNLDAQFLLQYTQVRMDQAKIYSESSDVDLIVTEDPQLFLDWVPLSLVSETFSLILPKKNSPETLNQVDPTKYHWIGYRSDRDLVKEFLNRRHAPLNLIRAYLEDPEASLKLVSENTSYATVLPSHIIGSGKHVKTFQIGKEQKTDLFLLSRTGNSNLKGICQVLQKSIQRAVKP